LEEGKSLLTGTTMKKCKKQIKWRQNKVQELLTRGYSQQETTSALHISPLTVSRDIFYQK
jgi:predicted transcriptional regulator